MQRGAKPVETSKKPPETNQQHNSRRGLVDLFNMSYSQRFGLHGSEGSTSRSANEQTRSDLSRASYGTFSDDQGRRHVQFSGEHVVNIGDGNNRTLRNPEQIQQILAERHKKLLEHETIFQAAEDALNGIADRVNKLESPIRKYLETPAKNGEITSDEGRKNGLKNLLGMLQHGRNDIIREIKTLTSMRPPIENFYRVPSEIKKITGHDLKDLSDKYYSKWREDSFKHERLLDRATSQLVETDVYIGRIQEALHKATGMERQLAENQVPRNREQLKQQLGEWDKELQENETIFRTAEDTLKRIEQTVSDLVKPIEEITSGQINSAERHELRNILKKLQREKNSITNEINTLTSMNPPIENFYGARSKIEKIADRDLKNIYKIWKANNEGQEMKVLLNRATSQLVETDANIEKIEETLHKTRGMDWQFEEVPTPGELPLLLAEGYRNLLENSAKFLIAKHTFRWNADTVKELESTIRKYPKTPARTGETTSDQIKSTESYKNELENYKNKLENILVKLLYAKKRTSSEINTLASTRRPIENFYGVRSEIKKIADDYLRQDYLGTVDAQNDTWQRNKHNKEAHIKYAISQIKPLDIKIDIAEEALHKVTRQLEESNALSNALQQ